jgi:hypothetical protein
VKRFQPSAETSVKERDFSGLVGGIHVNVCRSIMSRYRQPPYLYVDLHGGPGELAYGADRFDGSPLIAHRHLIEAGVDYEALHFEHNPEVAAELRATLSRRGCPRGQVVADTFERAFHEWLSAQQSSKRLGVVYSDPIDDPIPVRSFNMVAERFPRVDLLAYVAANQHYKRPNGVRKARGLPFKQLYDDVVAVNKKVVLIREPHDAMQWTFIFWTNWTDMKDWKAKGFHRLDTQQGQRIMARLNWTEHELHEMANEPLPFEETG